MWRDCCALFLKSGPRSKTSTSSAVNLQENRGPVKRLRIGITGATGFLGWHTRALLHSTKAHEVVPLDRKTFADDDYLRKTVGQCDAVLHFAGMNRGDD